MTTTQIVVNVRAPEPTYLDKMQAWSGVVGIVLALIAIWIAVRSGRSADKALLRGRDHDEGDQSE